MDGARSNSTNLLIAALQPRALAWTALLAIVLHSVGIFGLCHASARDDAIPSAPFGLVARLLNSPNHPLPAMPMIVPQLVSAEQVDALIAPGPLPTVFQISQPTRPNADLAKVLFFENMSVEYANLVNFRKIAAGSPAALHLYRPVGRDITKPVYVFADPRKQGAQRFTIVDESELRPDQSVDQIAMEGILQKELGVTPALFTSYPLTAENAHRQIYEYRAGYPNPAPMLDGSRSCFSRNQPSLKASINCLRVMMGLERFFYYGTLRFGEVDLSTQAKVYQTVIQNGAGGPLPEEPELWVINPETHQAAQYRSAASEPSLLDLSHAMLTGWLAANSILRPADQGLNTEVAWRELERLSKLQQVQP